MARRNTEGDYQLTDWCRTKEELQFAVDQVELYGDETYFQHKKVLDSNLHKFVTHFAVFRKDFVPTPKEFGENYAAPERSNYGLV